MSDKTTHDRLLELRLTHSLTQTQIAGYLGVSQHTYSDLENGRRMPSLDICISLACFYDVSLDYLLGLSSFPGFFPAGGRKH